MLEIRPNCECCDADIAPDSKDARICSFERTFCRACAEGTLHGRCPHCGGELTPRPRRPHSLAKDFPASTYRIHHDGCGTAG